ncbi:MAG TPA: hypothetical protein EYQ42_00560 [Thiotrichaceae bacterium]|jgi:hypothetical protein|nr:hypothetical protein [Thiotrichaceae bacterium]
MPIGACSVVIISIIATLYFIWTWSPILAQFGGDNATYLLTAKLFSPYSQSTYAVEYFSIHSRYPPLYPLLLGLLGGGESVLIAHLLTTSFLIAAILVLYKWASIMGLGRLHSLVLIVIFSMMQNTYMQALSILSENLYLLLSLSVLYIISLKDNSEKWAWVAVLLIVCATLTRSAGLPLVLSFIIYLFINRNNNKYLFSFSAILPMIAWGLFNNQDSISYAGQFSDRYSTDLVSILLQILDQSVYMLSIWHRSFTNGNTGYLLLSIIAIFCFFGMMYSLYLKRIEGIYVFLYMLMVLAWPYPAESMRLLYPVIPVLLVQTSFMIKNLMPSLNSVYGFHKGNFVIQGILLIILVPNLVLTINRFNAPVDEYLMPYKRTYDWYNPNPVAAVNGVRFTHGVISSLKDARNYIPEDQCVYSIKPSIIGLYMERISHKPPVASIDDISFYKLIEQSECRHFYLLPFASPTYNQPFYPYERMKDYIDIIKVYYLDGNNKGNIVAILAKLNNI